MAIANSINSSPEEFTESSGEFLITDRRRAVMPVNRGFVENLAFTHSGGTVTLHGYDGTALAATNPGYITMLSNATQGLMVTHKITANDTLTVSNLTNNLFGTTTSVAWGNSLPLYIGFMADSSDANLEPIIARLPHIGTSPAASANIGDPSAANADLESSVFAWNDITEGNYQSMQVSLIGSLTATKAAAIWTLDALTDQDGVGRWNDNRWFTQPTSQNGAGSGKYYAEDAGTAPVFDTNLPYYRIQRDGLVICNLSFATITTEGLGANVLEYVMPIGRNATALGGTFALKLFDDSAGDDEVGFGTLRGNIHRCAFSIPFLFAGEISQANADTNDQYKFQVVYPATNTA